MSSDLFLELLDGKIRVVDFKYKMVLNNHHNTVLFVHPEDEAGLGFKYWILEFCGSNSGFENKDQWDDNPDIDLRVNVLFRGNCRFDGNRHTWIDTEDSENNYLYYLSFSEMTLAFRVLRYFELIMCNNCDKATDVEKEELAKFLEFAKIEESDIYIEKK